MDTDSNPVEREAIQQALNIAWAAARGQVERVERKDYIQVVDRADVAFRNLRAERDRWQRRAQTGDTIAQDCIDELRDALRDTNDHIIRYGTSPDTFDWATMTARTRANAELIEATDG